MGDDPAVLATAIASARDVHWECVGGEEAPERRGACMAERGAVAAGQKCRHPPAFAAQRAMAHRVDAAEHRTQPVRLQSTANRPTTNACGQQLVAADDAVLAVREGTDHVVSGALSTHMVFK